MSSYGRRRNYYVDYTKKNHNNRGQRSGDDTSRFNSTPEISFGNRGFLVTALHEFKSYIEMKNILEQYYKDIYEKFDTEASDEVKDSQKNKSDELAEDELNKELDQLKRTRPFKQVRTQCRSTLFINIMSQYTNVDPVKIVDRLFEDLLEKRELICQNTFKVFPILDTFRCSSSCARESISKMIESNRFGIETDSKKYFIEFQTRGNYKMDPDEKLNMIKSVAEAITAKRPHWIVNREGADFIIIIIALKKVCCLSIVTDYFKRRKYNIVELCRGPEGHTEGEGEQEINEEITT